MKNQAQELSYTAPQIFVHTLSTESVLCQSPEYGGSGNPGADPSFGDPFNF